MWGVRTRGPGSLLAFARTEARLKPTEAGQTMEASPPVGVLLAVVCSNLAAPAQGPTLAWAILYPNGASDSELRLDGQRIVTTLSSRSATCSRLRTR